jgi:hypothetical protein
LNKKSHTLSETLLFKKTPLDSPLGVNRSDRFGKPVRLDLPGQSGRTQPAEKNITFTSINLLIRCMDSSETLGIAGVPRGLPLVKARSPKPTQSRGIGSQPSTPLKPTKLKLFRRVCWSNITKQRGTRSSYVTSNKNPSKKRPQNFTMENPRKDSENHQNRKTGRTQSSLEEPR